jgi:choice-of-anchor B domain-containing protein
MEVALVMGAFDLSDPTMPTFAGSWPAFLAGAQVVTYTEGKYAGRQVAFICTGTFRRLDIVDVTDKSDMFRIAMERYPSGYFANQGRLSADRQYFYLCDDGDERQGQPVTRTMVFDVSDLSDPTYLDNFTTGQATADHELAVHDGFIFEANLTGGLHIFEALDPVHPVAVGYFDTYPANNSYSYIGAFSTYPFFPSGTVIVSDTVGGLFILDPSAALRGQMGDVNCDGAVDALDIEPFLVALFEPGEYPIRYPDCDINRADINGDGAIDALDIEPFLNMLFS